MERIGFLHRPQVSGRPGRGVPSTTRMRILVRWAEMHRSGFVGSAERKAVAPGPLYSLSRVCWPRLRLASTRFELADAAALERALDALMGERPEVGVCVCVCVCVCVLREDRQNRTSVCVSVCVFVCVFLYSSLLFIYCSSVS